MSERAKRMAVSVCVCDDARLRVDWDVSVIGSECSDVRVWLGGVCVCRPVGPFEIWVRYAWVVTRRS